MFNILLSLLIGYILGSINPAFIFGKIVRGIDIRQYGRKTAGASNAFRVLGKGYGIFCGVFDIAKGLVALFIAYKLSVPEVFIYLTGIMAIIGHDLPFYMGFRGGKGAAVSYGLIGFCFYNFVLNGMPLTNLLILILINILVVIILNSGNVGMLIMFPFYLGFILYYTNFSYLVAFAISIIIYMIILDVLIITKYGISSEIKINKTRLKIFRKGLRFLAIVFPLFYFYFSKKVMLWIIGSVLLFFIIVDVLKMLKKIKFSRFLFLFKKNEKKGLSKITLFLIGCFLTVLFFKKEIAILAMLFGIFGDNFAAIVGLKLGRVKIFYDKTLQGTSACFLSCLIIGLFMVKFLNIGLVVVILGALSSSIAELFSFEYDNLTIPLLSGFVMSLI